MIELLFAGGRFIVLERLAAYDRGRRFGVRHEGVRLFWGEDLSQQMLLPTRHELETTVFQGGGQTPLVGFQTALPDGHFALVETIETDQVGDGNVVLICADREALQSTVLAAFASHPSLLDAKGPRLLASIGYSRSEQIVTYGRAETTSTHVSWSPQVERGVEFAIRRAGPPTIVPSPTDAEPSRKTALIRDAAPAPLRKAPPKFSMVRRGDVRRTGGTSSGAITALQDEVLLERPVRDLVVVEPKVGTARDFELLFGFSLDAPDPAGAQGSLERIKVRIELPVTVDWRLDPFKIAPIQRSKPKGEVTVLTPCPLANVTVGEHGMIEFEAALACNTDYGLVIDLDVVAGDLSRVFGTAEPTKPATIAAEILHCGAARGDAKESPLARIDVLMPSSQAGRHEKPVTPQTWPSPRLRTIPVGAVVRAHGVFPGAIASEPRQVGSNSHYRVSIDPDEECLFNQEVLFGFYLEPADPNGPHLRLERLRICVTLPVDGTEAGASGPLLFQIAQLHRPAPRREQAILRPCPQFGTHFDDEGRIVFEVVLATRVDYGILIDCESIEYELEQIFGRQQDPLAPARMSLSISRCADPKNGILGNLLGTIDISLKRNTRQRLCKICNIESDYVLFLTESIRDSRKYHIRAIGSRSNENVEDTREERGISPNVTFELKFSKLVGDEKKISFQLATAAGEHKKIGIQPRATQQFQFQDKTTLVIEVSNNFGNNFGRSEDIQNYAIELISHPLPKEVIAIDIGTAATALCCSGTMGGSAESQQKPIMLQLGKIVADAAPRDVPRRERGQHHLMSSSCALTTSHAVDYYVKPIQSRGNFDDRYQYRHSAENNDRQGAEARMQATGVAVDVHFPLWARMHEHSDVNEIGILTLISIKTQVCARKYLRFKNKDQEIVPILYFNQQDNQIVGMSARDIETADVFSAMIDALLNPYLEKEWPRMNRFMLGLRTMYVMTFPASISSAAQKRYRIALTEVVKRRNSWSVPQIPTLLNSQDEDENKHSSDSSFAIVRASQGLTAEAELDPSVTLVTEAAAAAWALMHASIPELWRQGDDVIKRLILFDVGAGTVDVAAFDFAPGKYEAPLLQTVSFSMPFGGNVMDVEIALDFDDSLAPVVDEPLLSPANWDRAVDGKRLRLLVDRVEVGKRCMKTTWLPVPDTLEFGSSEERPAPGHTVKDRETGLPVSLEEFHVGSDSADPMNWQALDLAKPREHLETYLKVMREMIVASTLEAANKGGLDNVETAVVISGRGSLFRPLHDAIQLAVDEAQPDGKRIKVRRAVDILEGIDEEGTDEDRTDKDGTDQGETNARRGFGAGQLMKNMTAQGAILWARRSLDEKLRLSSPSRGDSLFAGGFGVLAGNWNSLTSGFSRIASIRDLSQGENRIAASDDDQFLVIRPPLFTAVERCALLMQTQVGSRMINCVIRPIVIDGKDKGERGSPLPIGARIDEESISSIRFACGRQGFSIKWSSKDDADIHLTIVYDHDPNVVHPLTLSSSFLDALGS